MTKSQAGDPAWMVEARALIGLKEIVGSKHEPRVVQFFADAGHSWVKDDETAWCAAFANAMLKRAGIEGTGSLAARSFLQWGEKLTKPRPGCIVVFKRGNSSWQGHVAFYDGEDKTHVRVVGGNQGNAVSVARYAKSRLLGYRWPSSAAARAPANKPAAVTAKPKASADPFPAGMFDPEAKRLQEALKALGYHEVGKIDGKWGTKTRGALLAFKADAGLPTTIAVDDAVWTALARSGPRPLPADRASEKTPPSPAAKAAKGAKVAGGVIAAAGGADAALEPAGGLDGAIDKITGAGDAATAIGGALQPISDLVSSLSGHWPFLLIAVGVGLFFLGRYVFRDELESYRKGEWS